MQIALVTITHPVEPGAFVPFINGKAPLKEITIDARFIESLRALKFDVEVHANPYDPIAAANEKAERLSSQLGGQAVDEDVTTEDVALVAESEPVAVTVEQPQQVTEVVADEPISNVIAETMAATPEVVAEDANAGDASDEGVISDEELAQLRVNVESALSLSKLREVVSAYGIEIPPTFTRVKDARTYVLDLLNGE